MSKLLHGVWVLCFSLALAASIVMTETAVTDFSYEYLALNFGILSENQWRVLSNLCAVVFAGAAIGFIFRREALWVGALTGLWVELSIFYFWMRSPWSNIEINYTLGNVVAAMFYVFIFSFVSHVWWVWILSKFTASANEMQQKPQRSQLKGRE